MTPFEIIYVDTLSVSCDGGGGALGHPKIYMNLSDSGEIECGYCSRLFINRAKAEGKPVLGADAILPTPAGLDRRVESDNGNPVAPAPVS